ncbi:MAG: type 1 glutamine amidotransferase [archaeon]
MQIALLDCHKNRICESEKIARALPCEVDIFEVRKFQFPNMENYDALVISGADRFREEHLWIRKTQEFVKGLSVPILGICFGNHLLASIYGYNLIEANEPEVGWYEIEVVQNHPLFNGLPERFAVFQHHKRFVESGPRILARNENGVQAIEYAENVYGIQFHPEESPESGMEYLRTDPHCENFEAAIRVIPNEYIERGIFENFISCCRN